MVKTIELLLQAIVIVAVTGCLFGWIAACFRTAAGRTLLQFEPRRAVPWGLVDVVIAFVLVLAGQLVALGIVLRVSGVQISGELANLPPKQQVGMMGAMALASVVVWAIVLILVRLRCRATAAELGFVPCRWWHDLWLGLVAFAMLSVPVFLLQLLLTIVLEPFGLGSHPLIESLMEDPDPTFFIVGAISAVLVAPLVEEYFFRLLLQGWLENLSLFYRLRREGRLADDHFAQRLIVGSQDWLALGERPDSDVLVAEAESEPAMSVVPCEDVVGLSSEAANRSPCLAPPLAGTERAEDHGAATPRPARWPIVVSALVFACFHFGHGVAPAPLFVLALGLGYLYQRTHRILPCIVVHMLVNGLSMAQLWVLTQAAGPPVAS